MDKFFLGKTATMNETREIIVEFNFESFKSGSWVWLNSRFTSILIFLYQNNTERILGIFQFNFY